MAPGAEFLLFRTARKDNLQTTCKKTMKGINAYFKIKDIRLYICIRCRASLNCKVKLDYLILELFNINLQTYAQKKTEKYIT